MCFKMIVSQQIHKDSNDYNQLFIHNLKENSRKTTPKLMIDWKSRQPSSVSTVKRILRKYVLF